MKQQQDQTQEPAKKRSGPQKPVGSRHRLKCHYCHETGHPERHCNQKRHDLEKNGFKNR